jgi:hypothetical protein
MTIIVLHGLHGHRREYALLFSRVLRERGETVRVVRSGFGQVLAAAPVFYLMVDGEFAEFTIVAHARALLRRRTVGLLFKPGRCLAPRSARDRLKRWLLRSCLLAENISVLTIMPFAIEPRFGEIARAGIDEPQQWDLSDLDREAAPDAPSAAIAALIDDAAEGRIVVAALGQQVRDKGFAFFADLWASSEALRRRCLFVCMGEVEPALATAAARFKAHGGLIVDRFIEDGELMAAYRRADIVWSCYAPFYDQASGVFGRAVQFGKPAIVRAGSYLERVANALEHPALSLAWADLESSAAAIVSCERPAGPLKSTRSIPAMRQRSIETVSRALGLAPARSEPIASALAVDDS